MNLLIKLIQGNFRKITIKWILLKGDAFYLFIKLKKKFLYKGFFNLA